MRDLIHFFWVLLSYLPLPREWYRQWMHSDWQKRIVKGQTTYQRENSELHRYSLICGAVKRFVEPPIRVLDIGCGEGLLRDFLHVHRYIGIDTSGAEIECAKSKNHEGAEYLVADASGYSAGEPLNVAVFNESLYYIKNPINVVSHILSELDPDGLLIVCMFRTSVARSIWGELNRLPLLQLMDVEMINDRGDTSILRVYKKQGQE